MITQTLATTALIELYDATFTDGGFTIRYAANGTLNRAESGHVVSTVSRQYAIPADGPFPDFARAIEAVRSLHPTADALGGWVDDGQLYLDPVEIHTDRDTAIRMGRLRRQLAIYSLSNSEEIRL